MPASHATIQMTTTTPVSGLALAILLLGGCGDKPTPTMSPPSASGPSETLPAGTIVLKPAQ